MCGRRNVSMPRRKRRKRVQSLQRKKRRYARELEKTVGKVEKALAGNGSATIDVGDWMLCLTQYQSLLAKVKSSFSRMMVRKTDFFRRVSGMYSTAVPPGAVKALRSLGRSAALLVTTLIIVGFASPAYSGRANRTHRQVAAAISQRRFPVR